VVATPKPAMRPAALAMLKPIQGACCLAAGTVQLDLPPDREVPCQAVMAAGGTVLESSVMCRRRTTPANPR
jgi:hypothetical protein